MVTKNISLTPNNIVWIAFSCTAFWALIVFTGMRLPYVYTQFAFNVRSFILFPLLFLPLLYFGYIYHKKNQPTSYKQLMGSVPTQKARIKGTLYGLLGLVVIPGGLAWTSIAFPAWATMLFASDRYANVYHIDDIKTRSGAKWSTLLDLEMTDAAGEKITLRLSRSRYEKNRWKSDEEICVIGRTWMLGTIIDDTSRYLDRCAENKKQG